ncbi:MAG: phosphoribosylanthranilate isomerase [Clostridiales bacterium]
MTKIKICGLSRPCDIDYVNEAAPDYCGFIIDFPESHRNVTPQQVRDLTRNLAPGIIPVGVLVDQPLEKAAALLQEGIIAAVQLHGREDEQYIAALRSRVAGKPIWKAFRIRVLSDLAAAAASSADQIILDNGGGSGQSFDWSLTAAISRPFFLAGGLNPGNLAAAIRQVRPMGVDLSSGVETDRCKDKQKILTAVAAARQVN